MATVSRFRMPAEWFPHAATWVSWPRNADTWPQNLAAAQREFVGLVRAIAEDEPVRVLAGRPDEIRAAQEAFRGVGEVEIVPMPTDDAWVRDYGPTFVVDASNGQMAAAAWRYNAWGGKYPPYDSDQQIAPRIAARLGCPLRTVDLCFEGGAVEIDASGMLLTTRSCACDPRRNPDLNPREIERRIGQAVGASCILWLAGDALIGDDTDGHIDQLARFAPSGAILYAWTDDRRDAQYGGLAQNLADLKGGLERLAQNRPLVALPLPAPSALFGRQIPASYCNFYITNHSVLVPAFDAPEDDAARAIVSEHFQGRRIVSLPSRNLTVGLGSFHCLTQQQPALP